MARKFLYVCAGLLMLTLAYQFGSSTATAQVTGDAVTAVIGQVGFPVLAFTSSGDVYYNENARSSAGWQRVGNIFSGGPTPARQESWGQLKARFRPERQPMSGASK